MTTTGFFTTADKPFISPGDALGVGGSVRRRGFTSQPPGIRGESEKMKRKTYNNVLKAGKLIQKKGYEKQESLEMAVKLFDQLEALNNGMPVEWLIDKLALKQ